MGFITLQFTCSVQTTAINRVGGDFRRENLSDQLRAMNKRVIQILVHVGGVRNQKGLHQNKTDRQDLTLIFLNGFSSNLAIE